MHERIRRILCWLDAKLIGDARPFPIYRSTDGSALIVQDKHQGEIIIADFLETSPAAKVVQQERFRVAVLHGTSGHDSPCFWLDFKFLNPNGNKWVPLMMIHESKLDVIVAALNEVSAFLKSNNASDF